jgi:ABC-type dipeptide/oligopeptide/nickel transport system permease subunit
LLCVGLVAIALRLIHWYEIARDYKGQTLALRTEDGNEAEYVCTSAWFGRLKLELTTPREDTEERSD